MMFCLRSHGSRATLALTALLVLLAGCTEEATDPSGLSGIGLGIGLDGCPVRTSHFPGKVIVVDFWASWCTPAVWQLAALDSLRAEYGDPVQVVAVNVNESQDTIDLFLDGHPSSLLITRDADAIVSARFGVRGIPTDFLIDREGLIHPVAVGYRAGLPELRAALDALVNPPAGQVRGHADR